MAITPLFAIEAQNLLNDGKIQEAIDLCNEGLKVFPNYAAGEGVLARAYKIIGDESKAEETLSKAIERNPFNKGLKSIKEKKLEIPTFKIEAPVLEKIDPKDIKEEAPDLDSVEEFEIDPELEEFYKDEGAEPDSEDQKEEESQVDEIENDDNFNDEEVDDLYDSDPYADIDSDTLSDSIDSSDQIDEDEFEDEVLELDIDDPDLIPGLQKLQIVDFHSDHSDIGSLIVDPPNDDKIINIPEPSKKKETDLELETSVDQELEEETIAEDIIDDEILDSEDELSDDLDQENNDEITKLAQGLDGAKIIPSDESFPKPKMIEEEEILTPTIAQILFEQEAYEEAINAYKKLKKLYPDRSKEFQSMIRKIKKKL